VPACANSCTTTKEQDVSDVSDELDPLVMRLFGEDVARAPVDGFEAVVGGRKAHARRHHPHP
jgi:hypothetical protein